MVTSLAIIVQAILLDNIGHDPFRLGSRGRVIRDSGSFQMSVLVLAYY